MNKQQILLSFFLTSNLLYSDAIFSIDIQNDTTGDSFLHNTSDLKNILDTLKTKTLSSNLNYVDTNQITASLDFRGLPMTLKFSENSSVLVLEISSVDIQETFQGKDREASIRLLEEWFKNGNKSDIEKIMKELAGVSPIDPIAGNPNSLMGTMVTNDFSLGFHKVNKNSRPAPVIIAPVFNSLNIEGKQSDSLTLPLAYKFNSGDNPRENLIVSFPLSYVKVEGAKTYTVGFGLAYALPINNKWTITPSTKYAVVGSKSLGSLAQMSGTSLTSSYTIDIGNKYALTFANMLGYYTTVKLFDTDYAFNPGISNTVFRNAIMYSFPSDKIYKESSTDIFVINTQYTGTKLFLESYDEIGFSFGFNKSVINRNTKEDNYEFDSELKLGISYLTSSKADGFEVNFGYAF